MALKKSELYNSLWQSCDELRGGMDSSQYKDYILVLLFVKYVSDKYENDKDADIEIPEGGSFKDMVALKGQKHIGEGIDVIIARLAEANELKGVINVASFNDDDKLGKGKEMVDRLSRLVSIFENEALNFSKNRTEGDDLLGDAYEYLMRHFATESGKSKGQFYTPAEVSRIMAKVIGIAHAKSQEQTLYDPTCGSGSLLLKAADEPEKGITIYGQEMDNSTWALAKMNMILHGYADAEIWQDNTLSAPQFKQQDGSLKTFDFAVSNPPFSNKAWSNGLDLFNDEHNRFEYGIPPAKNGDYAFLLHLIRSLKSTGKGAIILPHGVLFRGNVEATIRTRIIRKGLIKGIIGLPANLFYGTGIPACIIVVDKENAEVRKGIFMIDAGKGFKKDGNKNRLREQDIHKIVDVFNKQVEIPGYSRMVPLGEISDPKNDYNLNIPRYINSQEKEDIQDIEAHLLGDIPNADIEALQNYWDVYPSLKNELFKPSDRKNYSQLKVIKENIKNTIFDFPEFVSFSKEMDGVFDNWKIRNTKLLKGLTAGIKPKEIIFNISEDIMTSYANCRLIDKYDVYQHLMDFWNEVMQDDCYLIAADGWQAKPYRILVENKQKKKIDKGWTCDLAPKTLIVNRFFLKANQELLQLQTKLESNNSEKEAFIEEHRGEEGLLTEAINEKGNIAKADVCKRLSVLENEPELAIVVETPANKNGEPFLTEKEALEKLLTFLEIESETKTEIKTAEIELDTKALNRYKILTDTEIKTLVVEDKWMANIESAVKTEMERISMRLTQRIKELAERYESPLPQQGKAVANLEEKVKAHLLKMGFVWN